MWKKIAPLLIVLSVALNIAFISAETVPYIRAYLTAPEPTLLVDTNNPLPVHRHLGITELQWQEIGPNFSEYLAESQKEYDGVRRRRIELIDMLADPKIDSAAINAKQEEILTCQGNMQKRLIEQLLAEREVLVPEQREEYFSLLKGYLTYGQGQMRGLRNRVLSQ